MCDNFNAFSISKCMKHMTCVTWEKIKQQLKFRKFCHINMRLVQKSFKLFTQYSITKNEWHDAIKLIKNSWIQEREWESDKHMSSFTTFEKKRERKRIFCTWCQLESQLRHVYYEKYMYHLHNIQHLSKAENWFDFKLRQIVCKFYISNKAPKRKIYISLTLSLFIFFLSLTTQFTTIRVKCCLRFDHHRRRSHHQERVLLHFLLFAEQFIQYTLTPSHMIFMVA
jgi:hypothetical protein